MIQFPETISQLVDMDRNHLLCQNNTILPQTVYRAGMHQHMRGHLSGFANFRGQGQDLKCGAVTISDVVLNDEHWSVSFLQIIPPHQICKVDIAKRWALLCFSHIVSPYIL